MATELYSLDRLIKMSNGNAEFVEKMISSFILNISDVLVQLEIENQAGKWEDIGSTCHRLKASLNYLSIDSLTDDILTLETRINELSISERKEKIHNIIKVTNTVIDSLRNR